MTENRTCQVHEQTDALCRIICQSAAGTPMVLDLCAECFDTTVEGFELFGVGGTVEVEWFEEDTERRERLNAAKDDLEEINA